ncbi:MAG: DnaJ domain-containing protein [Chloroflexaceae bacterium]|nr:DnaJ domain-containing protein [Chloroflexaceae bacterium]
MNLRIKFGLFKFDLTDYYAILGIPVGADPKAIRERYYRIARILHPDTCKVEASYKRQANQLLSRWINPSYKLLGKEKTRTEYQTLLAQLSQRLAGEEESKITLGSDIGRELSRSGHNLEAAYQKLYQSIAADQYDAVDRLELVVSKIAQLSELNLIYLLLKHKKDDKSPSRPQSVASPAIPPSAQQNPPDKTSPAKAAATATKTEDSPTAGYLRRAQKYLELNQPSQAVLELRDALKIDPNNSSFHGLMGLAYLSQKQLSMAKVHINKAWQSNPKDPIAKNAKEKLDNILNAIAKKQGKKPEDEKKRLNDSAESGNSGIFKSLFGGKKKS